MHFKQFLSEMALDLSRIHDPFDMELKKVLMINKKKALVYHGTSTNYFWQIVNKGFAFDETRKNWNTVTPGNYFSFDLERARMFTNKSVQRAGGEPIIFVSELPIGMLEQDPDDMAGWDRTTKFQSFVRESVNPKYITGVIFPINQNKEVPMQKFIQLVNKNKIPAIPPENEQTKRRFNRATMDDMEHAIMSYLDDLINYTDFSDMLSGNKYTILHHKILHALQSPEMQYSKIMHWTGDDFVKWLENILGEENTQDYYQTQREFQVPLYRVINKYIDRESFNQFRLGKK